jgi:hypothetical protein
LRAGGVFGYRANGMRRARSSFSGDCRTGTHGSTGTAPSAPRSKVFSPITGIADVAKAEANQKKTELDVARDT